MPRSQCCDTNSKRKRNFGLKYRGVSLATELLFRKLSSLEGTGPLPVSSVCDHGFFTQGGFFAVLTRLELYGLGSQVTGPYGTGSQVGGGFNWYFQGRRGARVTCDVSYVDDSPAQQSRTGFVAGSGGTLVGAHFWAFF